MKGYLIRQHERCIQVIDAIDTFKKRKEMVIDNLHAIKNYFPDLKQKYFNRLFILNKCIERMNNLYNIEVEPILFIYNNDDGKTEIIIDSRNKILNSSHNYKKAKL